MVGTPSLLSSSKGGLPVPAARMSPRHKTQLFGCPKAARWRISHRYRCVPSVARVTLIGVTLHLFTSRLNSVQQRGCEWHLLLFTAGPVLPLSISRKASGRRGEPHTRLTLPRRGKASPFPAVLLFSLSDTEDGASAGSCLNSSEKIRGRRAQYCSATSSHISYLPSRAGHEARRSSL